MSQHIKELTSAEFAAHVANAERPVLVDFWAPWCGPCLQMNPHLDAFAAENQHSVEVVKVNIDESPDLAQQYKVQSIPTLVLLDQGEAQKKTMGAMNKTRLEAEFASWIGL